MRAILRQTPNEPPNYYSRPPGITPPHAHLDAAPRFDPEAWPAEEIPAELTTEENVPSPNARGGDTFQLYIREIGQVKLLSREEEIALAIRIQAGDKEAREHMIKANLRLVVKIAREYEGLGLPLLDLISEGNIGLMKGVERFQPDKGAKLSTYVSWWIKQSIRRALANQSKTIRLPLHVTQKVSHMRRSARRLRETLDREATDRELADELKLDPRRLRRYREASRAIIRLDSPISAEDPTTVSETVADENAAAPFEDVLRDNDFDMMNEILATLDERESRILIMRFGLDNGIEKTLEEVAGHFGITRERIRQLQEQALEKMRDRIEKRDPLSKCVSGFRRKVTVTKFCA